MEIKQILKGIGFNDNKVSVYLSCLELGSATATEIAKKSQLIRTTVYKILYELVSEGLLEVDEKAKLKMFIALPPNKVVELFEEKKKMLENSLPDFLNIYSQTKYKPKIRFYDGSAGIKKVFEDTLNYKNITVYTFSPIEDVLKRFGRTYTRHFLNKRVKNNILRKDLRQQSSKSNKNWEFYTSEKNVMRQIKYLPENFKFNTLIQIYEGKISVIASEKENYAFIIESPELADLLKQIYEILWNLSALPNS